MKSSLKEFMRKFSSIIIILVSVLLGLLVPSIGLLWHPYTPAILAIIMFLVALNIEPKEFIRSVKNYRIILTALVMVFIVPPVLSVTGIPFFTQIEYSAIIIAVSSPSAIASVFWCDIFHGHTPIALVISMLTNLLALITLPLTILLTTQMTAQINTTAIITNLFLIVVIPLLAGQAFRGLLSKKSQEVINYSPIIQHILLLLLVWGSVAPGAVFTQQNAIQFMVLMLFILLVLSGTFAIAYTTGKKFGHSRAIALALVSSQKNSTLAIIIGDLVLGPLALPALIANLVGQNLFLIPARASLHFTKENNTS